MAHLVRLARSTRAHAVRVVVGTPGRSRGQSASASTLSARARPSRPTGGHRFSRRAWRRRGRKGQVAAVATMLGLLLVVTLLANYLATQLPAQMQVNDVNHAIAVADQIARLDSELQGASAVGAVGAVLSEPVSLGTSGVPPFSPSDGSSIGLGPQGSQLATSFHVTGPARYNPPSVGPAGGYATPCATHTTTTLTCSSSSSHIVWNFSSATPTSYSVTTSGGTYNVSFSASNSTIGATASSSAPLNMLVIGSNDTITLTISGSSTQVHITLIGNYDTVQFAAGSWSSSLVTIYGVGVHDAVDSTSMSASNSKLVATFFGSNDSVSLGTMSATSSYFNVYLNGFTPSSPASSCPVGNLAYNTDSVAVGTHSGSGTYNVTYNDSTVSGGTAPSPWTGTWGTASTSCPFYTTVALPQVSSGSVGGLFLVALRNTYTQPGVVAFDEGAVVLAQRNGIPLMLVPPEISYVSSDLTLWVPEFVGSSGGGVGTEVGTGTAEVAMRLVSLLNVSLPASGYNLSGTTSIAVTTPFAAAWFSALNATASPLTGHVVCAPKTSVACVGPFSMALPLATVYVNVTASALNLQVATFTVTVG